MATSSSASRSSSRRVAERGRVLGLDLGDARIGVAISDDAGPARRPDRDRAHRRAGGREGDRGDRREQEVARVVVGQPLLLSGERGARPHRRSGSPRRFARSFRCRSSCTTSVCRRSRPTARFAPPARRGAERRRAVDASAAAVILQAFLDAPRLSRPRGPIGRGGAAMLRPHAGRPAAADRTAPRAPAPLGPPDLARGAPPARRRRVSPRSATTGGVRRRPGPSAGGVRDRRGDERVGDRRCARRAEGCPVRPRLEVAAPRRADTRATSEPARSSSRRT